MEKVDYSTSTTPANYKCDNCGAIGVKLWRDWEHVDPLLCAECAGKHEKIDISDMDERGLISNGACPGGRTCRIGWFAPAVPTQDVEGFWGYSSAPDDACAWWYRLPSRKSTPKEENDG